MKRLLPGISLWMVLGALCWLLVESARADVLSPLAACAATVLPVVGVLLTAQAADALPSSWWKRIAFWTPTVAGWAGVLILIQGRLEWHPLERGFLLAGIAFAGLVAVWLPFKRRAFPSLRLLGELAVAANLVALAIGLSACAYDRWTLTIADRAEARWAAIGLPMRQFEGTLPPARENDGSRVLRQVLRERVNSLFYKHGTRGAKVEPAIEDADGAEKLVAECISLLNAPLPPADDIDLSAHSIAALESHAPALDRDYRRILETLPPRWASDPHEGYEISVPNFLGLRKLAQVIAADSIHRVSAGDRESAELAVAAGLRIRDALRENPTLVSLMLGVAIDALLAPQTVRLPASENALAAIARDAAQLRAEFTRRLQVEAWVELRVARQLDCLTPEAFEYGSQLLAPWLANIVNDHWYRHECAVGAMNGAEHAVIQQSPAVLTAPDLGESLHTAVAEANPTFIEINTARAALRLHATLLLREQVELIRDARAHLAAGKPVESRDSVVLPGLRWELTADPQKQTVSTRLLGVPEWIAKNHVTGPQFWVVPIDGSVAWQFHRTAQSASRD